MKLTKPQSLPGWFTAMVSSLLIAMQIPAIYDPTSAMEQLGTQDAAATRVIAMALVVMNGYSLIGALQENWPTYYFNVTYRTVSTVLFVYNEGGWRDLAPIEFGLAVGLGVCMVLSKRAKKA